MPHFGHNIITTQRRLFGYKDYRMIHIMRSQFRLRSRYSLFDQLGKMSISSGVILGVYEKDGSYELTECAKKYVKDTDKLAKFIEKSKFKPDVCKAQAFYGMDESADWVVLAGLGSQCVGFCEEEQVDLKKENVRCAINAALKKCNELKIDKVQVDDCGEPKAVGEAISLNSYNFDCLKCEKQDHKSEYTLLDKQMHEKEFEEGSIMAESQNFARTLSDTPANLMTPVIAGETIKKQFEGLDNVEVIIRDKQWIESKKMGLFLSVAQGSEQPPVLVEIHYKGASDPTDKSIGLVGKGITFDSGGISIKPSQNMHEMKADMQGGACVAGAIYGAAKLKLKCNIIGIIPFTENMPSGKATKPGDVHFSMSGKSVEIQNTDAEGRLVLADALEYIQSFEPKKILDMATLTGAIVVALGAGYSAVYTRNTELCNEICKSGQVSGDRMWRMPLIKFYEPFMKSSVADLNNIAYTRAASSCTAAAFLSEFVKHKSWAHLDIAGTMFNSDEVKYLSKGMSGRPTRTIIEFLKSQQ